MKNILTKILISISDKVTILNAISAYELMRIIDDEYELLTDDEKKALRESVGDNVLEQIFHSIIGKDRLSVFSADMHVKINHLGEIFYCPPTHKYMPDEINKAYKRMIKLRFPEIFQHIDDLVCNFMVKSGYKLSKTDSNLKHVHRTYSALKDEFKIRIHIYPSIVFVDDGLKEFNKSTEENIVIVPQEQSPAPFVNFIREYPELTETNSTLQIWVASPEKNALSPFTGYPKDEEFWINLTNPRKSLQSALMWSKGVIRSQVLDGVI